MIEVPTITKPTLIAELSDDALASLFVARGHRVDAATGARLAEGMASEEPQRIAIAIVEMLAALHCEAQIVIAGRVVALQSLAPSEMMDHLETLAEGDIDDSTRALFETGDPVTIIRGLRALFERFDVTVIVHPCIDDEPIDPNAADTVPIGTSESDDA